MPLSMQKYADEVETVSVLLPSGEAFDVGYYPASMTRARFRELKETGRELNRLEQRASDQPNDESVLRELSTVEDSSERLVTEVFAWWDIVDVEGGDQWPVDLDHFRRIPAPVFHRIMTAIGEQAQQEGKASRAG